MANQEVKFKQNGNTRVYENGFTASSDTGSFGSVTTDGKTSIFTGFQGAKIAGTDKDDKVVLKDCKGTDFDGRNGNDTVLNVRGDGNRVAGGRGHDTLINKGGRNNTLIGNKGDDKMLNIHGRNTTMVGGRGNDKMLNFRGKNTTMVGGKGNDFFFDKDGKNTRMMGNSGSNLYVRMRTNPRPIWGYQGGFGGCNRPNNFGNNQNYSSGNMFNDLIQMLTQFGE